MDEKMSALLAEEIARIEAVLAIPDGDGGRAEWERYQERFDKLPERVRPLVAYEIRRRTQSMGTSGMHGFGGSVYDPISFCGWADYGRSDQGVGFRINRLCFGERDAGLYYTDDDMLERGNPPGGGWLTERLPAMLQTIRDYSSGLDDIRIVQETEEREFLFRGGWKGPCRVNSFRFRLNKDRIRETVSFSGKKVPAAALGGYVFVLPRAGEFYCELGEIVEGKRVPLHIDDFCMK